MISVQLKGHTGNNLFQIASAIALAKRHGVECGYVGDDEVKGFELIGVKKLNEKSKHLFEEKTFSFYEKFLKLKPHTHLHGYFQSPKYFSNALEEVKKAFSFKKYIYEELNGIDNFKYEGLIGQENLVAIHIRRGDYLKHPDVYPKMTHEYYLSCINKIPNRNKILVFSDDIQWCKAQFEGPDYIFVTAPAYHSMLLMSNCDNVIMANSTFSWWGAYLGKPKKVFRPQNWFGNQWPYKESHPTLADCTKDLFPPEWLTI